MSDPETRQAPQRAENANRQVRVSRAQPASTNRAPRRAQAVTNFSRQRLGPPTSRLDGPSGGPGRRDGWSNLLPFAGLAACLVFGALALLAPLLQITPTQLKLEEGAQKKVAAPRNAYVSLQPEQGPVKVFRDLKGRLHVVGVRAGLATLRVYEEGKLQRHLEIEVTKPKLRKIEVTPAMRELLARSEPRSDDEPKDLPRMPPMRAPQARNDDAPRPQPTLPKLPAEDKPEPPKPPELEKERDKAKEDEKQTKLAQQAPDKKKAAPVAAAPADLVPAPPKPPEPKAPNKKMVELETPNKKKPKDAKFLAQEDSAVDKETRAEKTTLVKAKPGDEQPNKVGDKPRPGEDKAKLADDEDRAPNEAQERRLGKKKKEAIEELPPSPMPSTPQPKPRPRGEVPPEDQRITRIVPPTPGGRERMRAPGEDTGDRGQQVIHDDMPVGPPRRFRPFPSSLQIARILREYPSPPRKGQRGQAAEEGDDDSGAAATGDSKTSSRMPGGSAKWRKIWQRVRGFLENFIPEVTPGTHTALNAQKSTFAAFIARAHRKIHIEWGFGLWNRFRTLSSYHPGMTSTYSRLEIKLNRKGRVLRIGLVHTSGSTEFDGATMASVLSAAPFGKPPEDMVSADGVTYIHWTFFQDGRQCWTNDVQIFVNEERRH